MPKISSGKAFLSCILAMVMSSPPSPHTHALKTTTKQYSSVTIVLYPAAHATTQVIVLLALLTVIF